jgi:hypothetical protein
VTRIPGADRAESPDRAALATPRHGCIRCGSPIPLADALCAACNPGGLEQPAASQVHGTVFAGIGLAVVAMLVGATFLVGGVGPFTAHLAAAAPASGGLVLTLAVTNAGRRDGQATCRVWDSAYLGDPPIETYVRTPSIPAGGSLTFQQRVVDLGVQPRAFAVDCSR